MEKINELDNEQTALIKYGINNNIPPRLLLIKYKKGDIENSTIKTRIRTDGNKRNRNLHI